MRHRGSLAVAQRAHRPAESDRDRLLRTFRGSLRKVVDRIEDLFGDVDPVSRLLRQFTKDPELFEAIDRRVSCRTRYGKDLLCAPSRDDRIGQEVVQPDVG